MSEFEPFQHIVMVGKDFDWGDLYRWLEERDLSISKDAIVTYGLTAYIAVRFSDPAHAVAYKMAFG